MDGAIPLPFTGLSLASITSLVVEPVKSSTSTFIVTSSVKSLNEIVPSTSEIIGNVSGSHFAIRVPGSTFDLLPYKISAPYGIEYFSRRFSSSSCIVK